jgi:hypothetical protein
MDHFARNGSRQCRQLQFLQINYQTHERSRNLVRFFLTGTVAIGLLQGMAPAIITNVP